MILATTQVEDFDRFVNIFSTKGAEKRRQHGSKGSTIFRDPNEDDRVWVLFDWDAEGWQSFVSDPEVPAILREAGLPLHTSRDVFRTRCISSRSPSAGGVTGRSCASSPANLGVIEA